jgi:DNA-binding NarL/FixJ family response regulator
MFALNRVEALYATFQEQSNDKDAAKATVHEALAGLTRRERDVLGLVAQGMTDAEIAERLCRSGHAVHRHVATILTKLDVPSRAAVTAWPVQRGLS